MSKTILNVTKLWTLSLLSITALSAKETSRHHLEKAQKHFQKGFKSLFEEVSSAGSQLVEGIKGKGSDLAFSLFGSNADIQNPLSVTADQQWAHITLTAPTFDSEKADAQKEFQPRVLPNKFLWEVPLSNAQMNIQLEQKVVHVWGAVEKTEYDENDQAKVIGKHMEHYQFSQSLPHPIKLDNIKVEYDKKAGAITISAPRADLGKIVQIQKK
jgi:hypothetical protein